MPKSRSNKQSLSSKVGVSPKRLGNKIAKVKRDNPKLSNSAAAGKAAGILKGKQGRGH